jgi:CubicO group peptidase (beta-lactamase class C family)
MLATLLLLLCSTLAAPLAAAELSRAAPAEIGLDAAVLATISEEMQRKVDARDVAGIVAVIGRHGRIGYFETFGFRDIEAGAAMPEDAIFRLQSMTKPITAAVAMTLFDAGLFDLDEPIGDRLPEWRAPVVMQDGKRVPARTPITPRHLMTHASGTYYGGAAPAGVEARELPAAAPLTSTQTLAEWSAALAQVPLKFHPGTAYQYGHSLDVLGRFIEAVAGKPFDVVARERLFGPLGMVDTDFHADPAKLGRIAQLYAQPEPGQLRLGRPADSITRKPSLFMGGQGLVGTARDYARFAQMLLNRGELDGVRVLGRGTVELMLRNHLDPQVERLYGLGGGVDGRGSYTWGGANGTQFWIDTRNDLFAVFMVQTQGYRCAAYPVFRRLVTAAIVDSAPGTREGMQALPERPGG